MTRFVDIDLSRLPAVDVIKPLDFEADYRARIERTTLELTSAGIAFDVTKLHANPFARRERSATFFEQLLKQRVNDAAKAVRLAYSTGVDLDHIAGEFGVARMAGEGDDSLRERRQLAVEALSTAGPEGAYEFFTRAAHPEIIDAAIYDPHSGLCEPGEVLVVIASSTGNGVPRPAILDSAANVLDARIIRYADYTTVTRAINRKQKIRPLNDKVIVEAARDYPFSITAVLKVPYGPDTAVLKAEARKRLDAYLLSRRKVAAKVSDSSIAAALHVTDASGVALVDDVDLVLSATDDNGDIDPGAKGVARAAGITLDIQVLL